MSALIQIPTVGQKLEQALIGGDLRELSPDERVQYYNAVCKSLGLNPLTKPFAYLILNGKTTLYALKDCTEQLRTIHNISLAITSRDLVDGIYIVTARAVRADGRTDESTGAVAIDSLKGEAKANATMKAETKAKRRVTLSICGLGMLDETEVETIPEASRKELIENAQAVATAKIEALAINAPPALPNDEQALLDLIGTDRKRINATLTAQYLQLPERLGADKGAKLVQDILHRFGTPSVASMNVAQLREVALLLHRALRDAPPLVAEVVEDQAPEELQWMIGEMQGIEKTVRVFNDLKKQLVGLIGTDLAETTYRDILHKHGGKKHSNEYRTALDYSYAVAAVTELYNEVQATAKEQK